MLISVRPTIFLTYSCPFTDPSPVIYTKRSQKLSTKRKESSPSSTHRTRRKFLPSKILDDYVRFCARQTRKIGREDQKSGRTVVPRIPVDYAGFVSAHDRNFASISHEYPRVSLVTKQIRSPRSPLAKERGKKKKKYPVAPKVPPRSPSSRVTRRRRRGGCLDEALDNGFIRSRGIHG